MAMWLGTRFWDVMTLAGAVVALGGVMARLDGSGGRRGRGGSSEGRGMVMRCCNDSADSVAPEDIENDR